MTPNPLNLLSDTGEHEAFDRETTKTLAELAESPASELFVLQTHRNCWVKRWVRKFRITMAFALGALFAVQVGGYFALRASLRDAVRSAVTEVLKEKMVIGAVAQPAPNDAVALTAQGGPR